MCLVVWVEWCLEVVVDVWCVVVVVVGCVFF